MITRVAVLTGQRTRDVMREPYAHTLFTYLQCIEHERIERLLARKRAIDLGELMVFAYHEPKGLVDELHKWKSVVGLTPTHEEVLDRAQDVIGAMRQLDAGELTTTTVLHPGGPEPDGN